ncbi:SUMF1/EgtB/PvdO family nonheme iron enzyme [Spirulina sp. 06S082]|uniref:SUMF1/EgtB/PvdO family nonheme iron enzyme n=1 Tax=Spirulina sp. 06S082 TaxID=3110248 RepID=UPI003A4E2842
MVCLEDKKEQVYQEIKAAFQQCGSEAEWARLTQITGELSPQLSGYPSFIKFTELLRDLLLEGKPDSKEKREAIAQLGRELEIDLSGLGIGERQTFQELEIDFQKSRVRGGKNYAIAIGINNYNYFRSLQYGKRDAEAIATWFEQQASTDRVFRFSEDSPSIDVAGDRQIITKPTYSNLLSFLSALKSLLMPEDRVWFFFSGHGCRKRDKDYLMLSDSDPKEVESTAISVDNIARQLFDFGAGRVILLLDAERYSISESSSDSLSNAVLSLEQQLSQELRGDRGLAISYSSSPEQMSYEIEQLEYGSFTYTLLEALSSTQGNISMEHLGQFFQERVVQLNEQYGKPTQTPQSFISPASLREWIPFPANLQVFDYKTPTVNRLGEIIKQDTRLAQYFSQDLGNGVSVDMVAIPGGTFQMGSPKGEGSSRERPQHEVTVQPFFMAKYPITQAQWRAIASRKDLRCDRDLDDLDPFYFKGDNRPVERVSWYQAVEFCKRLSKLTEQEYRLPSEAEWEYACRAGTTTPFSCGETITSELANYDASRTYAGEPTGQYREETTPVGQFPPNAFGLYDMHGNVLEWCMDEWHENYNKAPTDGSAWVKNENDNRSQKEKGDRDRSPLRGGSWLYYPNDCRSAYRSGNVYRRGDNSKIVGFRVVCGAGRTSSLFLS